MKTHVTDEEPVSATARQPAHDETTPAEQRWPEHKDSGGGRSMLIVGVVLAFEEPTSQTFWTESVSGTGTQTVTAEVPAGEWSVVVMNADGSAGVGADLSVGATLPIIGRVAFNALVIGGVLFLAGIALVLLGLRRGA
jgi:hypothetical protein